MIEEEFKSLLETTGYPVTYTKNDSNTVLPKIAYYCGKSTVLRADGKIYYKSQNASVELYTKDKEPASESVLETVLDNADISYIKTGEEYIDSEKMYQILYEVEMG